MLRSIGQRLRHPDPWVIDGGTALVLLGLMIGMLASQPVKAGQHATTPAAYLLAVLLTAPLLTHRKFPRTSLAICLAALIVYALGRFTAYPGLPIFALTFGITLHSSRRLALVTVIAAAAAMTVALSLQAPSVRSTATWISTELAIVVAWLAAENLRNRRARWAELHARAERLEREREAEARRAVTEERLRIARELHDVVAHSMSVIAVQSAVGNHVMDAQPEEAKRALAAIEATSRSALTEMRRLLGVLRQDGEPAGSLVPAPGLADLAPLAAQVREAGLSVWIHVEGERGQVPPGVDLSAYRIIQEALTNVIKHAGSSTASVTVRYGPGSVTLEITDDGPGTPRAGTQSATPGRPLNKGVRSASGSSAPGWQGAGGAHSGAIGGDDDARRDAGTREPDCLVQGSPGTGHGIIGMRERVAVFGGEFAAGPRADGGFRVFARLPIPEVTEVTS